MIPDNFSSDDAVYTGFMKRQYAEAAALAGESDLLRIEPSPVIPPHFVAEYRCKGLVRQPDGGIVETDRFQIGIWFPPDYLRRVDPFDILRFFGPRNVWHPNISDQAPFICIGRLAPGTPLVDILYQCFDIITYHKFNPREDDCLNKAACAWARENRHRFPIDRRPLKGRKLDLEADRV